VESKTQAPFIIQGKELIDREGWEVKVSHSYRAANRVADKLTSLEIGNGLVVIFFDCSVKMSWICQMQIL